VAGTEWQPAVVRLDTEGEAIEIKERDVIFNLTERRKTTHELGVTTGLGWKF
jgi:hypothetical protein